MSSYADNTFNGPPTASSAVTSSQTLTNDTMIRDPYRGRRLAEAISTAQQRWTQGRETLSERPDIMYSTPLIQYAFSLAKSEARCLSDSIGTGATERDRQQNVVLAYTLRLISNLTKEQSRLATASFAPEHATTISLMASDFDQCMGPSFKSLMTTSPLPLPLVHPAVLQKEAEKIAEARDQMTDECAMM